MTADVGRLGSRACKQNFLRMILMLVEKSIKMAAAYAQCRCKDLMSPSTALAAGVPFLHRCPCDSYTYVTMKESMRAHCMCHSIAAPVLHVPMQAGFS